MGREGSASAMSPMGCQIRRAQQRGLIREKSQRLSVSKAAPSSYVRGDRTRLVQAFSNVIHNAVTYTDPGGEIPLEVLDSDAEVRVNVQDNGTSIAPALLPHLCDPSPSDCTTTSQPTLARQSASCRGASSLLTTMSMRQIPSPCC
jgi:C4-dicarboxylate-specific signal transduction histidine kinase